jgi:hypothetical protein
MLVVQHYRDRDFPSVLRRSAINTKVKQHCRNQGHYDK